ncbi:MAG: hypothetical protein M3017_05630, partial [Actinomycetota bacterium]|nr:hypothetical protein [Actinomycetota bacterium]
MTNTTTTPDTATASGSASHRPTFPAASLLGYPRIGRRRELKKAVEAFWAGRIDAAALDAAAKEIQLGTAR